MKKIIILAVLLFSSQAWSQISMEEAYKILLEKGVIKQDKGQWVYGSERILKPNTGIKSFKKVIRSPEFNAFLFFVDEAPYANWEHPAKYIFFNVKTKTHEIVRATTPPDAIREMKVLYKAKEIKERFLDFSIKNNIACGTANNKYAVIISGGYNKPNNHVRYWNDCSFVFKTLVNKYGYDDANIYVLMSDGINPAIDISNGTNSNLDLDGDSDNDIQYSATKANITTVFNTLSGILDEDDELFIFTTDHGGIDNSGTSPQDTLLYLWNDTITDDELAVEVNKVNAGKIGIVMEQCNSGGFIDDLSGPNRVIATAARYDELSWAGPTINTDEFVYYWTSAVNEALPSGTSVSSDANGDGVISKREAFDFAETNDSRPETPQYNEVPAQLGDQLTLNGTGDLYIKDNRAPYHSSTDLGIEPNPFSGPMYTSRDIWIRQSLDGGSSHQNPEYKTTSPNGVYVRIKNRGCAPIKDGKLRVYFSKASTGLSWPVNWMGYYQYTTAAGYTLHGDEITSIPISIPNLNPGDETIISMPWYPPNPSDFDNDIHHFCLIARIESQIDPIGVETTSVNTNTKKNNNIAWKNISVYDTNPANNITHTSVFVRNTNLKNEDLINLNFLDGIYGVKTRNRFLKKGKIIAKMSPELFKRWREYGDSKGIEIVGENTIRIYEEKAVLTNIPLKPRETFSIDMRFIPNDKEPFKETFVYDVVQSNKEGVVGGERFDIVYNREQKDDKEGFDKEILDKLNLLVSPNPTHNRVMLDFEMPKSDTMSISVQNLDGQSVLEKVNLYFDKGNNQYELNVSTLKRGIYIVTVTIGDGTITKKIIKF